MAEHRLFLTGSLAAARLSGILDSLAPLDFTWQVRPLGLKVAGLMTADMIARRLTEIAGADRIIVPGRCRGDLDALGERLGVPVERGPEELIDLPRFLGRDGGEPELDQFSVRIFGEIVDAPRLSPAQILRRAAEYADEGADVIDLGCLPQTPFPHLDDSVRLLKQRGYQVSVDSMQPEELLAGGRAGADYLLSLHEESLWIADEVASTPVLIPTPTSDLDSLLRCMDKLDAAGREYLADPILEPIHFGFTESVLRYHRLRQLRPAAPIMMGTGNLTELTEADTTGIHAILMGLVSELEIGAILTTRVSPHCRGAIREADRARRIMHWARTNGSLPKQVDPGLTSTRELRPFTAQPEEIRELAALVRDPNYRIQTSVEGIHVYNRDGLHTATDPFELYPLLAVEGDPGHAFYLGVELARAEIAWQLGKRYVQDQPLGWGCTQPAAAQATEHYAPAGTTLRGKQNP